MLSPKKAILFSIKFMNNLVIFKVMLVDIGINNEMKITIKCDYCEDCQLDMGIPFIFFRFILLDI